MSALCVLLSILSISWKTSAKKLRDSMFFTIFKIGTMFCILFSFAYFLYFVFHLLA